MTAANIWRMTLLRSVACDFNEAEVKVKVTPRISHLTDANFKFCSKLNTVCVSYLFYYSKHIVCVYVLELFFTFKIIIRF